MALVRRALISVSDKTGLVPFCRGLAAQGVEILSTGGTARLLRDHLIMVTEVADYTGFPEMLDGRVKTLHPKIHGGLLGLRDHPDHLEQMALQGIPPIDLVVVNLYPFEATVAKPGCTLAEAIENIDIGGPAMLRSAAKNHRFVTVITDPADYEGVMDEICAHNGIVSEETNTRLAKKVYARTAAYDAAISNYLSSLTEEGERTPFPATYTMQFAKTQEMRYGENPHQVAAFYVETSSPEPSVAHAVQLQGKELSYNNINDANGALELVKEFIEPAVVIVKHANPCGVALAPGGDLLSAYRRARDTDPVSAFGGIIACNLGVDEALAREIASTFVEVVIAPGYDDAAQAILGEKKNLRLLRTPPLQGFAWTPAFDFKRVTGGLLLQDRDLHRLDPAALKLATRRAPTEQELRDLLFAWQVVKHVKSNAIVYAKDGVTVGVGAGQMSRVDSSRIAVWKAQEAARNAGRTDNPVAGTVLASDAFFPFRDGVDAAAQAGTTAVIQPGGSMRDEEVINAANEHNLAMVFTGVRHFRH